MSDKQLALEVINELPETTTLDEIGRKISTLAEVRVELIDADQLEEWELTPEIRAKIERGEADIAAGRVHTHAEIKEMIAQWRSK